MTVRSPILTHDFGRTSTPFPFGQVLIDILVRALGRNVAVEQVSFAFVFAPFGFVGTSDAKGIDHVFNEECGWVEIG